ncbi:cyclic nucleotide-binding domain-containing protein [Alkalimarinus alittae]|uniref:Cyclic nucleotide-binding domain-containing protein n=1 Tax=Alkalimarinus alittae TaxID=2961619 RepID=A0ABY6N1T9_9ALTE|nr:cyclic nucleotide-binding domain-containing protein [Alkalimarinus alittae]UZE96083.1 cyclic nucleotide-binding domain-containing protein [Alkalimarinus alittae]
MSLQSQYNITEKTMASYSPLDQLSSTYLIEVIKKGSVVVFEAGDVLFEKGHALKFHYYLLAGKITVKKGLFSSKTVDSKRKESKHPINHLIPSDATVKAQTTGHLFLVDPKLLDRALAWSESNPKNDNNGPKKNSKTITPNAAQGEFDEEYFNWMTSLLEFPLFLNLPPANITELFDQFERVEVEKGQTIIQENDEGDYFYLLINGSAQVVVGDPKTKVATLRPGAYFGEEALVSDIVRSASVIMEEDGCLARLDKESFQKLLHSPLVQYVSIAEYRNTLAAPEEKMALLDIRSLSEFEHIPMPDCLHIPLSELRDSLSKLDKSVAYYLTEDGGQRSDIAAHILSQHQFKVFVLRN